MEIIPREWNGKEGRKHIIKALVAGIFFVVGGVYLWGIVGGDFWLSVIAIVVGIWQFDKYSLKNLRRELGEKTYIATLT